MLHLIRYQRLCFSTWTFWRNTTPTSQHDHYCFVFPVAVLDKFCLVSCQKFFSKRTVLPPRIIFSVRKQIHLFLPLGKVINRTVLPFTTTKSERDGHSSVLLNMEICSCCDFFLPQMHASSQPPPP